MLSVPDPREADSEKMELKAPRKEKNPVSAREETDSIKTEAMASERRDLMIMKEASGPDLTSEAKRDSTEATEEIGSIETEAISSPDSTGLLTVKMEASSPEDSIEMEIADLSLDSIEEMVRDPEDSTEMAKAEDLNPDSIETEIADLSLDLIEMVRDPEDSTEMAKAEDLNPDSIEEMEKDLDLIETEKDLKDSIETEIADSSLDGIEEMVRDLDLIETEKDLKDLIEMARDPNSIEETILNKLQLKRTLKLRKIPA